MWRDFYDTISVKKKKQNKTKSTDYLLLDILNKNCNYSLFYSNIKYLFLKDNILNCIILSMHILKYLIILYLSQIINIKHLKGKL